MKPVEIKTNNYFRDILDVVGFIKPFSEIRPRLKDVFAVLLEYHHKYMQFPEKERFKLIFDKEIYDDISNRLGISADGVANILSELRHKKLIIKSDKGYEVINPRVLFPKLDEITFKFVNESN